MRAGRMEDTEVLEGGGKDAELEYKGCEVGFWKRVRGLHFYVEAVMPSRPFEERKVIC